VRDQNGVNPAASALIVEPVAAERIAAASALAAAGFHVTVSETFASAKERMAARRPAVLVTEVCLAEYNGIHLVIRALAGGPRLAAVVTCGHEDPVLRSYAEKLGATFVVKPVSATELVAVVLRTLLRQETGETPLRPPWERRRTTTDRRASAADAPTIERRLQDRRQGLAAYHSGTVN
jgi:DNA-binding NtrC family response regulator